MIDDLEWVKKAAEHAKTCTQPPTCSGRYPDYDTCAVGELAADYLSLLRENSELKIQLTQQRKDALTVAKMILTR